MAQRPIKIVTSLIVMGGSSGSLDAFFVILGMLNKDFNIPIIFVLHRNSDVNESLAGLLSIKTNLIVKEADEKELISKGHVYLAPPDYHLLIEKDGSLSLDASAKIKYSRPSIDVTFHSAADVYKEKLTGIILSGANADGAEGIAYIKQHGGIAIVQAPGQALFAFMPQQAIAQTKVDGIFSANEIAIFLNGLPNL